jgi:hypothetical protein
VTSSGAGGLPVVSLKVDIEIEATREEVISIEALFASYGIDADVEATTMRKTFGEPTQVTKGARS